MRAVGSDPVSPALDRELVLMSLIGAVAALLVGVAGTLMVAAAVVTALDSGPWTVPPVSLWWPAAWRLLADPGHPGSALGLPWAPALGRHPTVYWLFAALIGLTGAALAAAGGWWGWRRYGPTPPGHATRSEIRAELSVTAARERARYTRPTLSPAQRRRAPLTEVGSPIHIGPIGPLCVPFENPTGTLAPTQSGKSRRALVHQVLGAPGALLCSTTKPDLLEFAALARSRRPAGGPVVVCDATGTVTWPAKMRWSPAQGCYDVTVAVRRSAAMVEAGAVGLRGVSGNDKVFRDRAKMVITAYLMAAAIGGRPMAEMVTWGYNRSSTPVDILSATGLYEPQAANLRRESEMVAETADAVWMSVRRVLEPLLDPVVLDLCSPRDGEGFDAESFVRAGGSLFLIAGETQAGAATPILTALAEYWIETAREMALHTPNRRLDPPATAVLDELTNATPLPELPAQVSDSAGRGVAVHWAAQSRSGLEETYGATGARLLIENTTLVSIWGGGKDRDTLEWVSSLSGHFDRRRYQVQTDGVLAPGRTAIGTETVPVYRPGDVRRLPRNQVLIIHRGLGVIRATTSDVSERPDWAQLRVDVDDVRAGRVDIAPTGYPSPTDVVPAAPRPRPRPLRPSERSAAKSTAPGPVVEPWR